MTISMTGFATQKGAGADHAWVWDIRSVNGKGLDLRLRVPEWIDGLEAALRADLGRALQRGNVNLTLKVTREGMGEAEGLRVNAPALAAVLAALVEIETAAMAAGVSLAPTTSADVLGVRGVLDTTAAETDTGPLLAALVADFAGLLAAFTAARRTEGAALNAIISAQVDRIAALRDAALAAAGNRAESAAAALDSALLRVMANAEGMDERRIAQELALIAVKNDVTEELDRLGAHVAAARALLAETGPVGRKFDFLMQEFMREANTLCSKAQAMELTRIGLDLKTVIDQMREQVQNVE